jgi:hypothetical protein
VVPDRDEGVQAGRARTQLSAKGGQQWVHRSIIVGRP